MTKAGSDAGAAWRAMRIARRALAIVPVGVLLTGALYFTVRALGRERPEVRPSTEHSVLSRESCMDCHAPIAAEWRASFHFRSVTGPFWERIRARGYASLFKMLRIACLNCHAPANVLDVAEGADPVERSDAVGNGVDCVSCHVSERGITGPGRGLDAPHEVITDERFRDPALASTTLCARCHEERGDGCTTVTAWRQTDFARAGVTCLHCHMPVVEAPWVAGQPARPRRSHRFIGDKSADMLRAALHASLVLSDDRKAVVRIINDRAGHSLPAAGMNALIVRVMVRGEDGQRLEEMERTFGSKEWIPGYLDFWPFRQNTKIAYGEGRDIVVALPAGHGEVSAEFRYRDWAMITDDDTTIDTISKAY